MPAPIRELRILGVHPVVVSAAEFEEALAIQKSLDRLRTDQLGSPALISPRACQAGFAIVTPAPREDSRPTTRQ
jgi:hypothetical protein